MRIKKIIKVLVVSLMVINLLGTVCFASPVEPANIKTHVYYNEKVGTVPTTIEDINKEIHHFKIKLYVYRWGQKYSERIIEEEFDDYETWKCLYPKDLKDWYRVDVRFYVDGDYISRYSVYPSGLVEKNGEVYIED